MLPLKKIRLDRAREALEAVENRQGVRSYQLRGLTPSVVGAGIYQIGAATHQILPVLRRMAGEASWVALLGVKNFGWEVAAAEGLDLQKIVLISCEVEQAPLVLSTLLEGFPVVVVGDVPLSAAQERTLAARVRVLGRVLLTTRKWSATSSQWFVEKDSFIGAQKLANEISFGKVG